MFRLQFAVTGLWPMVRLNHLFYAMMLYPLLFHPILKDRVWGGRALSRLGKSLPPDARIGESWEIADLPPEVEGGRSVIANGPLAGRTLHDAIASEPDAVLGAAKKQTSASFPLLIKYLDARENLSVQVHPSRAYVAQHPAAHLKDEAWIVIDHEPGAAIYKGLLGRIDERTLRAHIESGEIVNDLAAVPVSRGACHHLPSGLVHALGAGVLVAEIQTPSDTTFRIYDWGRTSRTMHIDEAMEVIFGGEGDQSPRPPARGAQPPMTVRHIRTTSLLEGERFNIERVEALDSGPYEIITSNLPEVWMMIEGRGRIDGEVLVEMAKGTTVLFPAAMPESAATLERGASLLRITLPSPLKGMMA